MLPKCDWDNACLICSAMFAVCKHENISYNKQNDIECDFCKKNLNDYEWSE
jgi:hypothetical protein